jgi:hypothetical protein
MANRKAIPPNHPRPRVAGGRVRPSQRIALRGLPMVARRQALNEQLLASTCPFGAPEQPRPLRAEDLPILLHMARERFSGAQSLLRSQAVRALGQMRSIDALEELTALATSPVEHHGIRRAAVAAIRKISPSVAELLDKPAATAARRPASKPTRRLPAKDKLR